MTAREEADRLIALVDTVRWSDVRDEIEEALVAADGAGYIRGRAEALAEVEEPPGASLPMVGMANGIITDLTDRLACEDTDL